MSPQTVPPPIPSILIVDDDPDICQALADLLDHEGYEVHSAGTGARAIDMTKHHHFGAVILDLGLPDMDGQAVLKTLLSEDPTLPVIILTAFTKEEKTVAALRQGAFAYLAKPYNREELKAVLRRAIGVKTLAAKAERIERALSDSEERFRSVVESAPDAIILADQHGNILSWNHAAQGMFQYSAQELLGQPLTVIMPPRYRAAHEEGFRRLRATGEARIVGTTLELHGLRKDGSEFPLELSLGTWQTKEGVCYCGIIRDITERKRVEGDLQLKLEMEKTVAGISDNFLRLADFDQAVSRSMGEIGRLSGASRAYLFLYRAPTDRWDNTHEWCAEGVSPQIAQLQNIHSSQFPWWFSQIRSGELIQITDVSALPPEARAEKEEFERQEIRSLLALPVYTGTDLSGFLGFDNVVTTGPWRLENFVLLRVAAEIMGNALERRRAEAALKESESKFRQLVERIREVFWMSNPEKTQILYISPGYEEIWGRSCESLYALPQSWMGAIHPEDRDRVREAALAKQVSGQYDEEYRIIRPDGSIRWIWDRAFPIRDESGTVIRIAGIAEDITHRRT